MKSITDFINEAQNSIISEIYNALIGKNDAFKEYEGEVCMPEFKWISENDKPVRTLSLILYKDKKDKNEPDYILGVWTGPDDSDEFGMLKDMLDDLKSGEHKLTYKLRTDSIAIQTKDGITEKNVWWSVRIFEKGDYKNLYIER